MIKILNKEESLLILEQRLVISGHRSFCNIRFSI